MESTITEKVIAILVTVILFATLLIPIVDELSTTTRDVTIQNEGAEWLKLNYAIGNDFDFDIVVDTDVTVGTQTGAFGDMIYYADADRAIISDSNAIYMIDNGSVHTFEDDVSVTNASGTLTIEDGTSVVYSGTSPGWAYIPDENGSYAFFNSDVENVRFNTGDTPVFAGSYAGVVAYNEYVAVPHYGALNLSLNADISNNVINSVSWGLPSVNNALSLTPPNLDLSPLDPSIINPLQLNQGMGLMSVPTPTYVDTVTGVWGFDIIDGTNVKIVSYSGTSQANIEIPATVSYGGITYDVVEVGKGGGNSYNPNSVFTSDITGTLIFPDSVTKINAYAFTNCTGINGLVFGSGLTNIVNSAFRNCSGITGTLTIPNTVTSIGTDVFNGCSGITKVILSNSMTRIPTFGFANCTSLSEVVIPDSITRYGDLCFQNCTSLTGILIIPEQITSISDAYIGCTGLTGIVYNSLMTTSGVYMGCTGLVGNLIFPDNIQRILNSAFKDCTGLTGLVIGENITNIDSTSFANSGIENVLNLSSLDVSTTSYGLDAEEVRDNVPAIGYIAPTMVVGQEVVPKDGIEYQLLLLIPVLVAVAVLLAVVYSIGLTDPSNRK